MDVSLFAFKAVRSHFSLLNHLLRPRDGLGGIGFTSRPSDDTFYLPTLLRPTVLPVRRIPAADAWQGRIQIDFSCMPIGAVFNPMPGELFLAGNTGTTSAGSIVLKSQLLHDFGQRT